MPRKTNVYILRLVAGKYYVGTSQNPQKRIMDHFANKGVSWTKKHAPLAVEAVYNGVDVFEENMWTKRLMAEHGILNVRGGLYVREEIPEPEQKMIQREIWSTMAVCMRCGRDGHMVAHCQHIRDVNGSIIMNWKQCSTCGNCAMLPLR